MGVIQSNKQKGIETALVLLWANLLFSSQRFINLKKLLPGYHQWEWVCTLWEAPRLEREREREKR
jgi:hypothetical protein